MPWAVSLAAGTVLTVAPPGGTAVAEFGQVSRWDAGYVGSYTVRNDSTAPIDGWRVDFDLPAGTGVTSSWDGVFQRTGDRWTVTAAHWNGPLAPGSSVMFGWVARGQGLPANCTLNGAACDGTAADHVPPPSPRPIQFDLSGGGLTLTWSPSADSSGPVRYELYESGRLLTTVTGTCYVHATSPPPPRIYVFAVRAVDQAGNVSAAAYRSLGQIWRGDEIPPPPAEPRADYPAPGLVRLQWTAPPSLPPFSAPPTAGYEILRDGVPVAETGATSITLPAGSGGPQTYGIRTINAVERRSAPAEVIVT